MQLGHCMAEEEATQTEKKEQRYWSMFVCPIDA